MPRHPGSPFSPEIADEWEQLISGPGDHIPLPDKIGRWQALYDSARIGEKWVVSPDDAGLIASLGNTLAMQSGDYALAARLADEWLSHPDVSMGQRFDIDIAWFWSRLGTADILRGQIDQGIATLSRALNDQPFSHPFELLVRADLHDFLSASPEGANPDDRIKRFVAAVIGKFDNREALADQAIAAATYEELSAILMETYSA